MYCTNCGAKVEGDEVFCSNCGERLLFDEEQVSNVDLQNTSINKQKLAQENEEVIEANIESFRKTLSYGYMEKRKNSISVNKKKPIKTIKRIHLIPMLEVGKHILEHKIFKTLFLPAYRWKWLVYVQLLLIGFIIGAVGYIHLLLFFAGLGLVVGIYIINVMLLYEIEIRKYINNRQYLD